MPPHIQTSPMIVADRVRADAFDVGADLESAGALVK
jgi:hypothetical protein